MEEKETGRLEAFSDGVIAIAITLLVLDLKVPLREAADQNGLVAELLKQWSTYFAFLASFLTILVMWINHHRLFTAIRRVDNNLMLLNGLLLLGITVVPFPTKIVAEYLQDGQANIAVIVYALWGMLIAVFFNLLWRYAASNNRLFSKQTDIELAKAISRQYMDGPLLYVGAMIIGYLNAILGILVIVALAVFFAIPSKNIRKFMQAEENTL
ncbi:MAG: DUF1211 domain-containing protein [Anaerolineae bacterium]|nr:DUF1211 domain-containing protein [Anaerolineae bacterium]